MTAHGASFSSSSKSKLWDVFLSFRGKDTRNGFTGHLHKALEDKGYKVFLDDADLVVGKDLKVQLFRAIEESRISIIIFSEKYADSRWCLDELLKIMRCKNKRGLSVLPIFYYVEPSDVRKQDGVVAKAFENYKNRICKEKDAKKREAEQERVEQQRRALTKAANLRGHHLRPNDNRNEVIFIEDIVKSTHKLFLAELGINSPIEEALMGAILKMGGYGKIFATAVHNVLNFDFKSLRAYISGTTRDQDLLKQADKRYHAKKLENKEALELFSRHAFRDCQPPKGYRELSKDVVSYCKGLPPALEVLGSFLYKRTQAEWKSDVEKLKRTPLRNRLGPA